MSARAILFLVLAAALIGAAAYVREFIKVDRCLDLGGRWNYETRLCEN
jgi:hypothetical protein